MVATTAAPSSVINNRLRERMFFSGMALLIVITVFGGFARTFYLRPYFQTRELIPLLIIHGIVMSSWILLLLTQTTLIATKRVHLHRRLGIAGGILAVLMVTIGTFTAIVRTKAVEVPPGTGSPLAFLTIPLGDMLVFGVLVFAGFYFRRKMDTHKRIMLLATIAILPAAVARLPFAFMETGGPLAFFGVSDLFILPLLIYDIFTRGHPHRATVLGGLFIVASHPLRMIIGGTSAWLAFATWLTNLV